MFQNQTTAPLRLTNNFRVAQQPTDSAGPVNNGGPLSDTTHHHPITGSLCLKACRPLLNRPNLAGGWQLIAGCRSTTTASTWVIFTDISAAPGRQGCLSFRTQMQGCIGRGRGHPPPPPPGRPAHAQPLFP